jgi:hypothetical protein
MSTLEYELEAEEFLGRLATTAGNMALTRGLATLPHPEAEWEAEALVNPIRRVYPDAMMEHFGHAAAAARSEAEAEAFVGALIPLAARLLPRVAPVIMRSAPGLIRGVAGVTRTLRQSPTTRPLVRAVPTIVRRTAIDLDRQVARGARVTPQQAVTTLARQTQNVLSSPQQARRAMHRNARVDRAYHRAASACGNCLAE